MGHYISLPVSKMASATAKLKQYLMSKITESITEADVSSLIARETTCESVSTRFACKPFSSWRRRLAQIAMASATMGLSRVGNFFVNAATTPPS